MIRCPCRLSHLPIRPTGTSAIDTMDRDELIAVAERVADAAGAVIRPFFRAGVAADLKSDDSPVTVADRTAEQAMRAVLAEAYPDHGVIGEEFGREGVREA